MKVLYFSLLVVISDQLTKFLVKGIKIPFLGINIAGMPFNSSKNVLGDFLRITFVENQGMAMGLEMFPSALLIIFTFIASIIILYYIFKHRNDSRILRISLAVILGGAIGNLIDRTFYGVIYNYSPLFSGKVVDFIHIGFWNFTAFGKTYTSWPILNFADIAITTGFLLILVFHKRIFNSINNKSAVPQVSNENETNLNDFNLS